MFTLALQVLLLSDRPGWSARIRHKLGTQARGRLTLSDGFTADFEGNRNWDAVLIDREQELDWSSLISTFPACARLVVVETSLSSEERLHYFSCGAQAVELLDSNLFVKLRELVTLNRALQKDTLSERLLSYAEKMDAVGRVALSVAHDFRHFIQVIRSGCFVLQRRLHEDSLLLQTVSDVRTASDQAHQLVSKLLAFASPEAGPAATVDLSHFVTDYLPVLRSLQKPKVRMHTNLRSLWPLPLDVVSLSQVLFNLVMNALDAVEENGTIWIETRDLSLRTAYLDGRVSLPHGRYSVLTVSDSGCGIDPEISDRVFEPFFTTKGQRSGSGLGLPSVLANLRSLGGHIDLHSQPGIGTTFQVFLPVSRDLPEALPLRGDLLLIDSSSSRRHRFREQFQALGLRVFEAPSSSVAERAFPEVSFALIAAHLGETAPEGAAVISPFSLPLLEERGLFSIGSPRLFAPFDECQVEPLLLPKRRIWNHE